jgi:hypothetical protein
MNDNVKVNLELSVNDVNVILAALREMPYRAVNELINSVVAQAQKQLSPQEQ